MARKRKKGANGRGSVYPRSDGRWGYSYTVDGKQVNRACKTQAQAVERLEEALAKIKAKTYVDPNQIQVNEWLSNWLEEYAPATTRQSTLASYRDIIEDHLFPSFRKIQLQKLSVDHVQRFVNKQIKAGYAPGTIRRHMSVLKKAIRQAQENKLIVIDPTKEAKLPKMEQKEIEFLSVEEIKKLLAVLPDTTNGRAIRFILGTGIRASELCGLRWCDVSDEGANISQIVYMVNNRALSEEEKKMERVKEAPKTSAGRRFIPFSDGTLPAILEEQKKQQRIERMKAGSCWIGGDPGRGEQYVFATKSGAPADRYNLGRTLRNCFDNAGLKRRGLHALRHTFATLWIQAGQDVRTLSEILGHTSVSFTMQRYVHSDTATKKRGMAVMASYLAE